MMARYRLCRLCLHLLQGLLTCALVFPLVSQSRKRALVRRWSARLLAICCVRLDVAHLGGAAKSGRGDHALIVANHVSWLDIFVVNAFEPCRFVAKAEIRGWPLLGWLSAKAGTIFIARGRARDVRRIFENIVARLKDGQRVAFFPEGTTAAQGRLLPFHANLFEAAIDAGVPVQPYAIRYLDAQGMLHPAADFIGDMSFVQSVRMILRAGGMTAQLRLLEPLASNGRHRRELAADAQRAIAAALEANPVAGTAGS